VHALIRRKTGSIPHCRTFVNGSIVAPVNTSRERMPIPKDQRPRTGVGVPVQGINPLPNQLWVCMGKLSSPVGFRAEYRPLKGFPLFSALRSASPDTVILLIVDYYAAIVRKTPASPCIHR